MVFGLPLGISFFGTAFSEPTLIELASGFEAVTHVRRDNVPTFAATMPDDHIAGSKLRKPHSQHKHQDNVDMKKRRPHHL